MITLKQLIMIPPKEKLQQILQKMKNGLSPQEYLRLYQSGFCPDKFYGTTKVHKISEMTQ